MVRITTSLLVKPLMTVESKKNEKKILCPPPLPRREIQKAAYWKTPVMSRLIQMYAYEVFRMSNKKCLNSKPILSLFLCSTFRFDVYQRKEEDHNGIWLNATLWCTDNAILEGVSADRPGCKQEQDSDDWCSCNVEGE